MTVVFADLFEVILKLAGLLVFLTAGLLGGLVLHQRQPGFVGERPGRFYVIVGTIGVAVAAVLVLLTVT